MKNLVLEDAERGEQIDQKITELKIQYHAAKQRLDKERTEFIQTDMALDAQTRAYFLLQDVAEVVQQEAHNKIAAVVCRCLQEVFDEPYELKIGFEKKKGRTEAVISFVRDGEEIDPMSAAGGGVVDVAAFALRLACLVLHKPKLRPLLVLDEPFRFVSRDYLSKVRQLIETLSEEMKIQIVMVTHNPLLECGKVVEVS